MIVELKDVAQDESLHVTTAALADHQVHCTVSLDPEYLYEDKVLLQLRAYHDNRPLVGGKAIARITYPTLSIDTLIEEYADELKEIILDPDRLLGDKDDETLIKLGLLAAQYGNKGVDIFERETVDLELRDDGREKDPKPDDGVYTAFFDPKLAEVAGNFQIKALFTIDDEKLGTHRCVKLIPVHVPKIEETPVDLVIKDVIVRRNRLWSYTIVRARVVHANDKPATPAEGVSVSVDLLQHRRRIKSGNLLYYRRGNYYVWRLSHRHARSGRAILTVQARLNGVVVAKTRQIIRL